MSKNSIDRALDLEPIELEGNQQIAKFEQTGRDFEYARTNLYDLISKGTDSLEEMIAIAEKSQSTRAYEVVNQILKTMASLNSDLVDVEIKRRKQVAEPGSGPSGSVTHNNLFVGSTAELQAFLKDQRKNASD